MDSTIVLVGMSVLVVVVVGSLVYGLFLLLNPTRTATDRLKELRDTTEVETFNVITLDGQEPEGLAAKLSSLAAPASQEEQSRQRQMLVQAGFKNRRAYEVFNSVRVTLAVCLPLVAAAATSSSPSTTILGAMLVACAAGYYVPALYIQNLTDTRKKGLIASFPDSLDLLVSCVEAGLGLDAAFKRVAAEMETASPDLAREFQMVTHEMSAGMPRIDALRNLEKRTGLDEVRSLVNMLSQAERFGTSIANSLRSHAKMTRQKRMARAEEEAAKVSPKLTIIMILFLLPVLGIVLMGPAILRVVDTFG